VATDVTGAKSRVSRRGLISIGILCLWAVGLGMLARQEFFRPHLERLAEAGLRINQSTAFFGVSRDSTLVGYSSSIIDTTPSEITITNYLVTEISGPRPRSTTRSKIKLSRTFRLKDFESSIVTNALNIKTTGKIAGDSMIFSLSSNDQPPKVSVIHLDGPVLLPQLVPLAIALTERPTVGKEYAFPVFDPSRQAVVQVKSTVHAESTFVLADSAALDSTTHKWAGVRDVPVTAWRVSSTPGGFNGWLDETGHIIRTAELGSDVMRTTFEQSFENWMLRVNKQRADEAAMDAIRRGTRGMTPRPPGKG
jgi:hypothetical protein